jgi:hypothetical protein
MHQIPALRAAARLAGAFACLLSAAPAVAAEEPPDLLNAPFNVALGTFLLETDTEVRLDGRGGTGTPVDWERTFGGGEATRFRVDGFWRFAERHKLRVLWFSSSFDETRRLDRDIDWGDETFPVDARVRAQFDFDVYELAYEYAFLRRDAWELTGSIGLHYTDLALALSARAESSGGTLTRDIREEGSVGAPLPVIGLRGLWALPHDLWIDASAQYFALSIDEYDGSLSDLRAALLWQPKRWLGLGIGYNRFGVDVDVERSGFRGSLDWAYEGPMIYYSATF